MNLTKKDQDAINHVASVSNNPHAAMIVKWLITGCKVKRKDSRIAIECPSWLPEVEYELIEPKPAKPAYRGYIDRDGEVFTARRSADGNINQAFEAIEWLSDWIEYDPPKQWPTPLVERIASIDLKAAEWIVDHWDDLLDNKYTCSGLDAANSKTLISMFGWHLSPQGRKYWKEISQKLGEE